MHEIPEWPYAYGKPDQTGLIRSCPEDFLVEEIPRVQPEGEGGHLWLWVEKCQANTDWVARELAKIAACASRDVGFAGLKDRHAITRQWFSLPATDGVRENLEKSKIDGVNILASCLHSRKLKRGTLKGNLFQLTIRDFVGDAVPTEDRLKRVRAGGVPNYFGPQRFGAGGQNVARGLDLIQKGVRLQRNKRSIYLSALRSFLFNQVLAERVRQNVWNTMIDGDLAMLDGTHSIFSFEMPDSNIEERCKRLDIHPTGPMPGENGTQPGGEAVALEQLVLQEWPELGQVLISQRVQASRRSLRLVPADFEWRFEEGKMMLAFGLPPGTYATTILREILRY